MRPAPLRASTTIPALSCRSRRRRLRATLRGFSSRGRMFMLDRWIQVPLTSGACQFVRSEASCPNFLPTALDTRSWSPPSVRVVEAGGSHGGKLAHSAAARAAILVALRDAAQL